jgi:hypothetical protein
MRTVGYDPDEFTSAAITRPPDAEEATARLGSRSWCAPVVVRTTPRQPWTRMFRSTVTAGQKIFATIQHRRVTVAATGAPATIVNGTASGKSTAGELILTDRMIVASASVASSMAK